MRRRRCLLITLITLLVGLGGYGWFAYAWLTNYYAGTMHTFVVSPAPEHLTEELAYGKAFKSLVLSKTNNRYRGWLVVELDQPRETPWGTRDRYASRNTINPNRLSFRFRSEQDGLTVDRFVSVELSGELVTCQVTPPK